MDHNEILPQYSRTFRFVEYASLFSFAIMWSIHFYHSMIMSSLLLLISSWLLADFVSGIVHWFADTWGTGQWLLLGPTLIRSFREHHIDEEAITRHDFVETNGASALVCLPILIALFFLRSPNQQSIILFFLFFTFWILLTNQFHKWSHELNPPALVKFFQKCGVILSKANHDRHHTDDHTEYYFITNGFVNYFLGRRFFNFLEKLIHKLTGLIPREDDAYLLASLKATKKLATPTSNPEKTSQK